MRTERLRASVALVVATMLASATLAACSGDGADDLPATPPPLRTDEPASPGLELTPEEQAAVDEVREVFDLFMNAYIEVATSDEVPDLDVHFRYSQYAGGNLVIETGGEIGDNFLEDRVAEGSIDWEFVEVVDVDLDRVVRDRPSPELRLRYCLDETGWIIVEKSTGDPVGEAGGRHLSTITAGWLEDWGDPSDQTWRVTNREEQEEQLC